MSKYQIKNLKRTTLSLDIILNNGKREGCHIGARHTKYNKSRILSEQELKNTPEIGLLVQRRMIEIIKHTDPKQGNANKAKPTKSVTKKPKDKDTSKE